MKGRGGEEERTENSFLSLKFILNYYYNKHNYKKSLLLSFFTFIITRFTTTSVTLISVC